MKLSRFSTALSLSLLAAGVLAAQPASQQIGEAKQEFSIAVGELSGGNPSAAGGPLTLDAGAAFEANYAHNIRSMGWGALYWELEGLASPIRYTTGTPTTATHLLHSVFVAPGLKLQFTPKEPISPWVAAGGGYAWYNSSNQSIGGGTTTGGSVNTYAADFGAGVDFALNKRYMLRGEFRGIYTGRPNFATPTAGGQFNFLIGGGLVWRFGK